MHSQNLERSNTRARRLLAAVGAIGIAAVLASPGQAQQPQVDVMHFWTSGGEALALKAVRDEVERRGAKWTDVPVAGGGGDKARTALQARIAAGNPPTAMLILGTTIIDWAKEGLLTDVNAVAAKSAWDKALSPAVQGFTKVEGRWVSVPTNIHRVDMMWASKAAFDRIGATPPKTWDEFNALAPKFKAAGIVPIAHGGQAWQELYLFETVVLGIGGPDFYRKAFVALDKAALSSPTMVKVFEQMRTIRGMVDPNFSGRDWNLATAMVIKGEAAMQIMGDWAKGEFTAAGKVPGQDFLCVPTPGSDGAFDFLVNSLTMFEQKSPDKKAGQAILAEAIMQPEVQVAFNLAKGSIPARLDVPGDKLDACAQATMRDLKAAEAAGKTVPTLAGSHAAASAVVGAVQDVVTRHFNSSMTGDEAVKALVAAIDIAR